MTQKFLEMYKEEGFADTRIPEIEEALAKLHSALSKCDSRNLNLFFSRPIIDRVGDFARAEGGLIDFRTIVDADKYRLDLAEVFRVADRRDYLCKNAPKCPQCGADQVQLVDWIDACDWKCRHCKYKWEFEP